VLVKGLPEQDHTRSAKKPLRNPKQNYRVLPDSASLEALALPSPKTGARKAGLSGPAKSTPHDKEYIDYVTG
jgi:hypothetical protein